MTASTLVRRPVLTASGAGTRRPAYRRSVLVVSALSIANALAFFVVQPPVGDLYAALARQSAAVQGVGLGYWFGWYSGGSTPGNYSVLAPYLSSLLGAALLGALATITVTPLVAHVTRGTAMQLPATAVAAIVCGASLWSGRVPFALGTATAIVALIGARSRRLALAVVAAVLTALSSPVSAALLAMGLCALFVTDPSRRRVAAASGGAALVALVTIALVFGTPGPQPFTIGRAALLMGVLGLMLLARPASYVRIVIVLAIAVCPLLAIVPNGMGSNFQRMVWIYLPIAVLATAGVRLRRALVVCAVAICLGVEGTAADLWVSAQPISSEHYYDTLAARLDHLPGVSTYRVEVVPDGTHVAAYALLNHAILARGYETQQDNAQNPVLLKPGLDAVAYKVWLDNNAVGFVAINQTTLAASPEDTLVRRHRPSYLTPVWSDSKWRLYRVADPTPIVPAPARVVSAGQASMVISVPKAGTYGVSVRWSRFLQVTARPPARATVTDDGYGFTLLNVSAPGRYTLHG